MMRFDFYNFNTINMRRYLNKTMLVKLPKKPQMNADKRRFNASALMPSGVVILYE
jgi:hypothetical protein